MAPRADGEILLIIGSIKAFKVQLFQIRQGIVHLLISLSW